MPVHWERAHAAMYWSNNLSLRLDVTAMRAYIKDGKSVEYKIVNLTNERLLWVKGTPKSFHYVSMSLGYPRTAESVRIVYEWQGTTRLSADLTTCERTFPAGISVVHLGRLCGYSNVLRFPFKDKQTSSTDVQQFILRNTS